MSRAGLQAVKVGTRRMALLCARSLPLPLWQESATLPAVMHREQRIRTGSSFRGFRQDFSLLQPRQKNLFAVEWGGSGVCLSSSRLHSTASEAALSKSFNDLDAFAGIDVDNLGFGIRPTDRMYVMKYDATGHWQKGELLPFGNLEMSPSSAVLNYGQGLFEGLKAYRTESGQVLLFRPVENALRMQVGAHRLSMPAPSVDAFVNGVKEAVLANKRWIPPTGKGSLYIRPLLLGTGAVLGLAPASEYTFVIYVSPVGNYFKEGLSPIALKVEEIYHRAAPGGTGLVKTIGNYAPVLKTQLAAKNLGYADVLYLDAVENKYVEEVSSCNIFMFKNGAIVTPDLRGTILPGVTRKSIIELARIRGYQVDERPLQVEELLEADEVFCSGTAVVISPVGSITYGDKRVEFNGGKVGKVSQELYKDLTDIQTGKKEDKLGWVVSLD